MKVKKQVAFSSNHEKTAELLGFDLGQFAEWKEKIALFLSSELGAGATQSFGPADGREAELMKVFDEITSRSAVEEALLFNNCLNFTHSMTAETSLDQALRRLTASIENFTLTVESETSLLMTELERIKRKQLKMR